MSLSHWVLSFWANIEISDAEWENIHLLCRAEPLYLDMMKCSPY